MSDRAPSVKDVPVRGRLSLNLQHVEILMLGATLLATVIISSSTLRQATRHFEIERTSAFVARFNSPEMVDLREHVDRWLESGETPSALYARSTSGDKADSRDALDTIARLRTMANFFQEFGSAIKIGSVDEHYGYVLLGSLCIRYGHLLEPFIVETRAQRKRSQVYSEVFLLRDRMQELDDHEDGKTS